MAREFKETAHTKTDMQSYGDNYDHIFKKYKEPVFMDDWKQVSETVLISQEDIKNCKNEPYVIRSVSIGERLSDWWWSFRWELSNFIFKRD